jgi:high-affinity iron transporter
MLGVQPRPTVIEVAAYLMYAIPMGLFVLWPQRRRSSPVPGPSPASGLVT